MDISWNRIVNIFGMIVFTGISTGQNAYTDSLFMDMGMCSDEDCQICWKDEILSLVGMGG